MVKFKKNTPKFDNESDFYHLKDIKLENPIDR